MLLGGGREKKEDSIDPAVGIVLHKKGGDRVAAGESLCTLRYNDQARAARAKILVEQSYQVVDSPPTPRKLIRQILPAQSGG
jgi:thymidine phosphorylase